MNDAVTSAIVFALGALLTPVAVYAGVLTAELIDTVTTRLARRQARKSIACKA